MKRVQITVTGPALPYTANDNAQLATLALLCTDNGWPFTSTGVQLAGVKRGCSTK